MGLMPPMPALKPPLPPKPPKPAKGSSEPWWHGSLGRAEAEARLTAAARLLEVPFAISNFQPRVDDAKLAGQDAEGIFLVRERATAPAERPFAVSVLSGGKAFHVEVRRAPRTLALAIGRLPKPGEPVHLPLLISPHISRGIVSSFRRLRSSKSWWRTLRPPPSSSPPGQSPAQSPPLRAFAFPASDADPCHGP